MNTSQSQADYTIVYHRQDSGWRWEAYRPGAVIDPTKPRSAPIIIRFGNPDTDTDRPFDAGLSWFKWFARGDARRAIRRHHRNAVNSGLTEHYNPGKDKQ